MVKEYGLKFKVDVDSRTNKMFKQQKELTEQLNKNFKSMNKNLKVLTAGALLFGTAESNVFKKGLVPNLKGAELRLLKVRKQMDNLFDLKGLKTFSKDMEAVWGRDSAWVKASEEVLRDGKMGIEDIYKTLKKGRASAFNQFTRSLKELGVNVAEFEKLDEAQKGFFDRMMIGLRRKFPIAMNKVDETFDNTKRGLNRFGATVTNLFTRVLPSPIRTFGRVTGAIINKYVKWLGNLFKGAVDILKQYSLAFVALSGALLAFGSQSPALQVELALIGVELQKMSIIVGDALVPALSFLKDQIQGLINWYNALDPEIQDAIDLLILFIFFLGGAAVAVGVLGAAIGALASPLGLLVIGLGVFALAVATDFGGMGQIFDETLGDLGNFVSAWQGIIDNIGKDPLRALIDGVGSGVAAILAIVTFIPLTILEVFGNLAGDLGDMIGGPIGDLFRGLGNMISNFAGGILDILIGLATLNEAKVQHGIDRLANLLQNPEDIGKIKTATSAYYGEYGYRGVGSGNYQHGGIVPGVGAIPATVHGGEMIINPSQQKQLFAMAGGGNSPSRQYNQEITLNINMNEGIDSPRLFGSDIGEGIKQKLRSRGYGS